MKKEDILEKYMPKGTSKKEVDKIFKELQSEKIGSIKAVVEDIEDLIGKRETLNKEIFKDIEKIESGLNNFILQLGDGAFGRRVGPWRQGRVRTGHPSGRTWPCSLA